MPTTSAVPPERRPLAVLCVIAALLLMWATLRPFNPHPHNDVSWLPDTNGIRFGGNGIVYSERPLSAAGDREPQDNSCTIEVALRPFTSDDAGNFLTFSSDDNLDAVFLRQWREFLVIYKSRAPGGSGPKLTAFEIDGALRVRQLVLVTITSGPQGTSVYVNGKLAQHNPRFVVPLSDLYRRIVLGTSPTNYQVWHGEIHSLAIYGQEASPAQAMIHYKVWSSNSTPLDDADYDDHILARYDFSGRRGNLIRVNAGAAPPLLIPSYFSVPYKPLLDSPIAEFDWSRNYRIDVIANVLGFMPFGFVLCGFFASYRPRWQAILIATLVGGLLSFSVEFAQFYIPKRDSSWTDVISNTTGSLFGALVAYPALVYFALRIVFLVPPRRRTDASRS